MKIHKKANKKDFKNLLMLKLLKNKWYLLQNVQSFNEILLVLKTGLKLIFKFNIFNKKILFLNLKDNLNNFFFKILKNTKHIYVPKNMLFSGLITNPSIFLKYLALSKNLNKLIQFLFGLTNKMSFVIFFKLSTKNSENNILKLNKPCFLLGTKSINKIYDYSLKLNDRFNINLFFVFLGVLFLKTKRVRLKSNSVGSFSNKTK